MINWISQSFMVSMREYLAGTYCGNLIKVKYVDGRLLNDQSESMSEGTYFEFCATGAVPKNGQVPMPKFMASAIKSNKGSTEGLTDKDMYAEYRIAKKTAEQLRGCMAAMGLRMVHVGKKLTLGRFNGTLDLIVEATRDITFVNDQETISWKAGDQFIIDLKYSGLLYDRWSKFGWEWSNIQKEFHGTQAIQYHYIGKMPFYFWVTSPPKKEGDEADMKIFRVPIDQDLIEAHIKEGNKLLEELEYHARIGLVPRPSMNKCMKCVLRAECSDKHEFPRPETISLHFT